MPRPPRRNLAQPRDDMTTTPTRQTTLNPVTATIPPFMLETPPHAPFITTPLPPSANATTSIIPQANAQHRLGARAQQQTPRAAQNVPVEGLQSQNNAIGSNFTDSGQTEELSFVDAVQHEADDVKELLGLRDISSLATWTLSSAKPGCALAQLRHPSPAYFWQSDGPQPHTLTLHFFKLVAIVKLRIYLNFELDESYTPTKIKFFAGMSEGALVEFASWEIVETTDPETGETQSNIEDVRGWIDISLAGVGGKERSYYDDSNLEHWSGNEVDSDNTGNMADLIGGDVLKAMVVQIRICENHQNGKDTHVRGFQVFARDETSMKDVRKLVKKNKSRASKQEDEVEEEIVGLQPADWMGDPELR